MAENCLRINITGVDISAYPPYKPLYRLKPLALRG